MGGIVAISIVGVAVLVGIALLYSFIKRKSRKKVKDNDSEEETYANNNISSTFTYY